MTGRELDSFDNLMPSCERKPGKPVGAAFNPFATIEIAVCARPHRRRSSPSICNRTCLQARFGWLFFLCAMPLWAGSAGILFNGRFVILHDLP